MNDDHRLQYLRDKLWSIKGNFGQPLTHFNGMHKFIEYLLWITQLKERNFKKKNLLDSGRSFMMKGMLHFPNEDVICYYMMDWHIMVLFFINGLSLY